MPDDDKLKKDGVKMKYTIINGKVSFTAKGKNGKYVTGFATSFNDAWDMCCKAVWGC